MRWFETERALIESLAWEIIGFESWSDWLFLDELRKFSDFSVPPRVFDGRPTCHQSPAWSEPHPLLHVIVEAMPLQLLGFEIKPAEMGGSGNQINGLNE